MADIDPFVRHMILCDDVIVHATDARKYTVVGMVGAIRPLEPVVFPVVVPQLCVLLETSGGRGRGRAHVVAEYADTGAVAFSTPIRDIAYPVDPLAVLPVVFRIERCIFPRPGLYWMQVWHNGRKLTEQPLPVRASHE